MTITEPNRKPDGKLKRNIFHDCATQFSFQDLTKSFWKKNWHVFYLFFITPQNSGPALFLSLPLPMNRIQNNNSLQKQQVNLFHTICWPFFLSMPFFKPISSNCFRSNFFRELICFHFFVQCFYSNLQLSLRMCWWERERERGGARQGRAHEEDKGAKD